MRELHFTLQDCILLGKVEFLNSRKAGHEVLYSLLEQVSSPLVDSSHVGDREDLSGQQSIF
jgi:hypothetical protein